jgi:flagellar biosynthesis protein FlhF
VRLKSYHSATVESAIRLAHIELGDQAVFLGARRNDVGSDPNQAYEVSFAVLEGEHDTPPTASAGGGAERRWQPGAATAAVRAAGSDGPRPNGPRPNGAGSNGAGHNIGGPNSSPPNNAGSNDAPSRVRPTESPRAVAATADAGALVSWKKLLRHVGVGNDPADAAPDAETAESAAQDAPPPAAARGYRTPAAKLAARNGPGRGAPLPHWREFVPGDARGGETVPPPGLLSDAARVAQAGAVAAHRAAPPRVAAQGPATQASAARPSAVAQASPLAQARPLAQSSPFGQADSGTPPRAAAQTVSSPPRHGAAAQAAAAAQPARKKARVTPTPADEPTAQAYSLEKLGADLEELRRMFQRQQSGRAPLVLPSRELLSDPRLARLYRGLSDNAVEPSLAAELVAGLEQAAAQGADAGRLTALLAREIRGRFKTDSELGHSSSGDGGAGRRIAALVGPSGAGKTTAVAKLAFRCGLLRRRRVRLFSVDQLRIGAVEPLQAFADLMNTPLQVIDEFDKLGPALGPPGGESDRELTLIDTPGYGRREWERARRLAAVLAACGDVDVHLVLDLRTKVEDLRRAVENFGVFRPAKLLFTRLDETTTFGTMLNETVRTGLPLSFVSVGQRVPEDIVPAGEPELLRLLLRDRASS